ncbi:MAG: Asp-tRNA(Asn)/Glu-tRNA(Gln) amidotransferase subunit GatC [Actinomycetota bacterium]
MADNISKKDVEHVALLARLELSEEEKEIYTRQLGQILEHAAKIQKLNTAKIPPTAHIAPLNNVLRDDKVGKCLSNEEAMSNAPKQEDGGFVVPKIV